MKTLNTSTGILAVKSISLGLLLLIVYLIQVTIWAVQNIAIPSGIAIAKMIAIGIEALNEWADAQADCPQLAIAPCRVIAFLAPAKARVLVTKPVLPSSNNVIAIAPRSFKPEAKKQKGRPKKQLVGINK